MPRTSELEVKWSGDKKEKKGEVFISGKKLGTATAEGLVVEIDNQRLVITEDVLRQLAVTVFTVKAVSHP